MSLKQWGLITGLTAAAHTPARQCRQPRSATSLPGIDFKHNEKEDIETHIQDSTLSCSRLLLVRTLRAAYITAPSYCLRCNRENK